MYYCLLQSHLPLKRKVLDLLSEIWVGRNLGTLPRTNDIRAFLWGAASEVLEQRKFCRMPTENLVLVFYKSTSCTLWSQSLPFSWIILLSHLTVSKMPSLLVVSRGLSLNFLKQGVLPFMAGPDRGAALTNLTNQSGLYWFYKWKLSPSQVK